MNQKRSAPALLPLLCGVVAASLASCSFFGWEAGEAKVTINLVSPGQAAAPTSRVVSGAGGSLQIPDFVSYDVTITASDMDTIKRTGLTGAVSINVPLGAARTFSVVGRTSQASFTGTSAPTTISAATTINVTMALADNDLFLPATKGGTTRVAKASVDAAGATSGIVDVQVAFLRDPAGAAYSPVLSAAFDPGDCALDAEGFLYLSDSSDAASFETDLTPRIVKIRAAASAAPVYSDAFYSRTKPVDSTAGKGVSSVAIDRTRGIMYFARGGESWFYRKSLYIVDPTNGDQRGLASQVKLDAAAPGSVIALDCDASGNVFVLRSNAGPYYLDKYAAPTVATNPPTYASTASTPATSPIDVMAKGSYVYVLGMATGTAIQRYDATNLAMTPSAGGNVVGSTYAAGEFATPARFLAGPAGRVFVKVSVGGSPGAVSFTDMSGWAGWAYHDIGTSLP